MSGRLLVLGLRGGSWQVFKPAVQRGLMPNLNRLLRTGSHGDLRAFLPTYMRPNWASFWTGVHPGRHMIFASAGLTQNRVRSRVATSDDLPFPSWLELASRAGIEAASVYAPLTHPAVPIHGSVVTDGHTRGSSHPTRLAVDLTHQFPEMPVDFDATHFPHGGFATGVDVDAFVERHTRSMIHTRELTGHLVDRGDPGVVMVDFFSLDQLLHGLWAGVEEPLDEDAVAGVERGLRTLDHELGILIEHCQPDAILAFSEHGMMRCTKILRLAPFLYAAGILEPRPPARSGLRWLGRTPPARALRRRLNRPLRPAFLTVPAPRQPWRLADFLGSLVYLDDKAIYLRGDRAAATLMANALESVQDPASGAYPIARAWDAKDLYGSISEEDWHVLVLEQNAGYTLRTGSRGDSQFETIVAGRDYLAGTHTTSGFWLFAGHGVESGRELDLGVTNLAPAILSYLGVSVPAWMEEDPAVVIGGRHG